jgi:hypothetical protein
MFVPRKHDMVVGGRKVSERHLATLRIPRHSYSAINELVPLAHFPQPLLIQNMLNPLNYEKKEEEDVQKRKAETYEH